MRIEGGDRAPSNPGDDKMFHVIIKDGRKYALTEDEYKEWRIAHAKRINRYVLQGMSAWQAERLADREIGKEVKT